MIWLTIAILCLGTLAFKTIGPVLAGGWEPPAAAVRVIELLTPALLTALVITSTADRRPAAGAGRPAPPACWPARAVLLARGPLVLALVVGAAAAAGLRLLT